MVNETITLEGHLIDSDIMRRVFDKVVEEGGEFEVLSTEIIKDPDEIVNIWGRYPNDNGKLHGNVHSFPDYVDLRDQSQSIAAMAAYTRTAGTLSLAEDAKALEGLAITPEVFDVLGVALGVHERGGGHGGAEGGAEGCEAREVVGEGDGLGNEVVGGLAHADAALQDVVGFFARVSFAEKDGAAGNRIGPALAALGQCEDQAYDLILGDAYLHRTYSIGMVEKLISHSSFQLKGSGWYVTDYARKGGAATEAGGEKAAASRTLRSEVSRLAAEISEKVLGRRVA